MSLEIGKDSVSGPVKHGHKAVTTSPQQLTVLTESLRGVLLRAPGEDDPTPNEKCVWIGRMNVTADSSEGTGGMPLAPGESCFIPIDNPSSLYVVSTETGNDIAWMAL